MDKIKQLLAAANRYQETHRWVAIPWAVNKKFSDDSANLLVVALGWYGFTSIYPVILVVVSIFGFIGAGSLGHSLINTLHKFPVIGNDFNLHGHTLKGSVFALIIGVLITIYGAQGVTQAAGTVMNKVWGVPRDQGPGFLPRLGRSVGALGTIAFAFLANAGLGSISAGNHRALWLRIVLIVAQLLLNVGLYLLAFRLLVAPAAGIPTRALRPGAIMAAVAFTALITVGTGLVEHQLKHMSNTYGAFASVIGVVTFLLLLAKITVYSAELNPVLRDRVYPRALPTCDPLSGDRAAEELRVRAAEA